MPNEQRQYPSGRYAWFLVILLTVAYVLSFVDRYVLGLLVEPIKADLELTDTEIGLLLGLPFTLFYALAGIPLGYLADRKRRTWIVAAGVAVWSLATAATGLARNFWHVFMARMAVGAGEATLSPCAMSMISDSFPREKRGKPIAVYTAALSLGAGVASIVSAAVLTWAKTVDVITVPLVGQVAPWQFTFIVVGLPGVLIAIAFLFVREPKRQRRSGVEFESKFLDAFRHVWSRRGTYASYVSFVCIMTIVAYSQGWYAAMFERTWGWPAEKYALVNGIILLCIGPLTVIAAGWMNDRLYSKGRHDAALIIMILGVLIMVPTGIIAPLIPSPWLAIGVLAINTIGIAMTSATGVTGLMNITPPAIRGQTVAIYYMTISLAGLLGPLGIGWLSDNVFDNEHLNYAAATIPAVFGIPVLLLARYTRRSYNAEHSRQRAENAAQT